MSLHTNEGVTSVLSRKARAFISVGVKMAQTAHLLLAAALITTAVFPVMGTEDNEAPALLEELLGIQGEITLSEGTALLPIASPENPERIVSKIRVVVTGYSSTPEQTDDTPFITAANTMVRDGVVAANFLPIGTKIKLPDLYGEKVFVVEDRLHPRKYYVVDIWFENYWEAKEFGAKHTYIEVLEG